MSATVLLVDDDRELLTALGRLLTRRGYQVLTAENGDAAVRRLEEAPVDVVITDIRMPGMDGHELLRHSKRLQPEAEVILLTGYGTVESAVRAMKEGAYDYLAKPPNPEELLILLQRILETKGLRQQNQRLQAQLEAHLREHHGPEVFEGMVGQHPAMREVFQLIEAVAPRTTTVLLVGESGVGKELAARAIHRRSPRRKGPFIVVNCAALPDPLLEAELFGYEPGAFTDARERRIGKFEAAHGGTLFLDEVASMSPLLQQKLLRVLEERMVERLGSHQPIPVDLRIVAATNRDLKAMVRMGAFREDLYYRLNVLTLRIPPLRERRSDIPLLVEHFLRRHALQTGQMLQVSPEAMSLLEAYSWPGNVRELENALERATILCQEGVIRPQDLPPEVQSSSPSAQELFFEEELPAEGLKGALERYEEHLLRRALERSGGNHTQAAALLKIHRTTLIEKLRKYGLLGREG